MLEKAHRGAVLVIGPDGRDLLSIGDVERRSYPRSAMKLMQVLPMLASEAPARYGFGDPDIALMCGSHNGEEIHVNTARRILQRAGVAETALRCGTHPLLRAGVQAALIRAGREPTAIHNNCSGKHAGFLALCRHRGWPLDNYTDPEHPLQRAIRALVCELCRISESELTFGVDGCTAPNYGMPLRNLALGYQQLMTRDVAEPAIATMLSAVTSEPFMVAGSDRYCTLMMRAAGGRVVGKVGADGVYCLGIRGAGIAVAIKIEDGSEGPQYHVAQAVLEGLGMFADARPPELERFREEPRNNCRGQQIGSVRVTADIRRQCARLAGAI